VNIDGDCLSVEARFEDAEACVEKIENCRLVGVNLGGKAVGKERAAKGKLGSIELVPREIEGLRLLAGGLDFLDGHQHCFSVG
jgi:hypothetical protein